MDLVKSCVERLSGIAQGLTWDEHMQAATDKFNHKELEAWEAMGNGTTLFKMGEMGAA